ncbi:MAG TPA: histone-like nucleoid-structuring protein Lsr2 [Dermatophilaceae bacterium]|nr:histone-like nucleoid-structuring protein Lsr2 [Dermatophilaceae bacterium]
MGQSDASSAIRVELGLASVSRCSPRSGLQSDASTSGAGFGGDDLCFFGRGDLPGQNGLRLRGQQHGQRHGGKTDLADIRSWGREQGRTVSDRGRVPAELIAAFDSAH